MTEEQAFKVGFLTYCAEQGMSLVETHKFVKKALEIKPLIKESFIGSIIGGALRGAGNIAGNTISIAPLVGLGAPVLAGGTTGYLAARLANRGSGDAVEDMKNQELINEYERLTDEAKRKSRMKKLQNRYGMVVPIGGV